MNTTYRIRLELMDISPPIWRELQVPADFRLDQLHTLIQIVMGWEDCHLHEFQVPGADPMSDPPLRLAPMNTLDDLFSDGVEDEAKSSLGELLSKIDDWILYTYDFGDHWRHEIRLLEIQTAKVPEKTPRCLGGERAGPPEDCGGLPGYENLLEVLSDPGHEQYEDLLEWVGGEFDPEAFDQETVAKELRKVKW
ncbi:MAG: plasmid pRiA4b ORF-3 family protein [Candidatus Krumholzibacteria bacterium]|nr:plasmid pRiA4b ORF-3 family protein [Candidatus Krumholzibacteria bacterium]